MLRFVFYMSFACCYMLYTCCYIHFAGRASPPYNQMHDSPPYGVPFANGMPPGGPQGGVDRPSGFLPGQHQMPPQGFIPPEASGGMPAYMGGGFRPPGMPPHLRLPPPGPLPGPQQHKRPGIAAVVPAQDADNEKVNKRH